MMIIERRMRAPLRDRIALVQANQEYRARIDLLLSWVRCRYCGSTTCPRTEYRPQ